jgi:hypothetical protein
MQEQYEHVQHGWLHIIFWAVAAVMVAGASLANSSRTAEGFALAVAGIFVFCALVFGTLTVRDEGDHLVLRFGPVPVFGTLIRYADLTAVEPGRTSLIDGWGIHYIPWRGWTYNLWGFGCVKLTLGKRVIRVGSDDVENLAAFLKAKIQPPG